MSAKSNLVPMLIEFLLVQWFVLMCLHGLCVCCRVGDAVVKMSLWLGCGCGHLGEFRV